MPDRMLFIQTPSIPKTPVGPEYFVVNITGSSNPLSSDKTSSEILSAASRNAIIEAYLPNGEQAAFLYGSNSRDPTFYSLDSSQLYLYVVSGNNASYSSVSIAPDLSGYVTVSGLETAIKDNTSLDILPVVITGESTCSSGHTYQSFMYAFQTGLDKVCILFDQNDNPVALLTLNLINNQSIGGYGISPYGDLIQVTLNNNVSASMTGTYQISTLYVKPSGGIPKTDLASSVQDSLSSADTAYQKPSGGIPKTDLAQSVQTSLSSADSAYQKPAGGIPATDLAGIYAGAATAGGAANKAVSLPSASVDSTSTETAFTATVSGITALEDGVFCYLTNGVVTSASGWTLNVNGLGAKPVYGTLAAATRSTTIFNINYTMLFVYNTRRVSGGCWDVFYGYDSSTNTIGYQLRTNSTSLPVSGATYRYRLLFTSADGTKYVPANTSTSTNATAARTVNQTPIDPFGPIRYYGTTTAVSSGSRPGASYLWEQYNITFGYSFNRTGAALTLTSWMPVYVKCAPQADGSAIMDSTTPYVQQLPSSADGKIYIFLGIATAATMVEIVPEHPVYCYRNGMIQQWTGLQTELSLLESKVDAIPEEFLVTVTYNGSTYISDKTFSEITSAYNAGKAIKLLTSYGVKFDLTLIDSTHADFSGIADISSPAPSFYGVTYSITSSGVEYRNEILSRITIELELDSGTSYTIYNSNIHLSDIKSFDDYGAVVEILVDGQKYPLVFSSSLEAIFGRIDPYTNSYVMFQATRSDTFTRSEVPLGGGGGGDSPVPIGQTPMTLLSDMALIRLQSDTPCSYTVQSDTIIEFDFSSGSVTGATVTKGSSFWEISCNSGVANWYSSYVDVTATGLTVNTSYNFVFDARGVPISQTTGENSGHWILYDGNGSTLLTRSATDAADRYVYSFTATTTNVRLRWYPASNYYFQSGVSIGRCVRAYINKANTIEYGAIIDISGTFDSTTTLYNIPKGATISSTPSCYIFATEEEEAAQKPLHGKTVVCFGDSLFGMYRGDTSATAFVAELTGATVYNVGFGGCRMSVHPTSGYAAFSMWALADALATDTWTTQDAQASSGSDYFPEQLALLKSIDFQDVDYIVIHYGTNDFQGNVQIDDNQSPMSISTICGALRYSLDKLMSTFPDIQIFVSLPVFRYWTSGSDVSYSDDHTNTNDVTLPDVNRALANVAYDFHVPVIDNYYGMSVNKYNASSYYVDGTHHNELGRQRFGEYIGKCLVAPDPAHPSYEVLDSVEF